jgi:hypothetical protein
MVKLRAIIFSTPFEGGVAGTVDYLIVTDLFPGRGG